MGNNLVPSLQLNKFTFQKLLRLKNSVLLLLAVIHHQIVECDKD